MAVDKIPRKVRVGNCDVPIWECYSYPNEKDEMGRHWFESADGIQTATYRQMCQKLGGRPKPRLPEDEHRPATEQDNGQSVDAQLAGEVPAWEPWDSRKPIDTELWGMNFKDPAEVSDDEFSMQMVWAAERIRQEDRSSTRLRSIPGSVRRTWIGWQKKKKTKTGWRRIWLRAAST